MLIGLGKGSSSTIVREIAGIKRGEILKREADL